MIVDGHVLLLSCPECGAQHPHFQFYGDTDMATDGVSSAGDREGSLIALFRTSQDKVEQQGSGGDLRSAMLARVIEHAPTAEGLDFATFRKL